MRILRFILFSSFSLSVSFFFQCSAVVAGLTTMKRRTNKWNSNNQLDSHSFFCSTYFGEIFAWYFHFSPALPCIRMQSRRHHFLACTYCYDVRLRRTGFTRIVLTRLSVLFLWVTCATCTKSQWHQQHSLTICLRLFSEILLYIFPCKLRMCVDENQVCARVRKVCQASKYTISYVFRAPKVPEFERVTAWKCRNKQNTIHIKINYIFSLTCLALDSLHH